MVRFANIYDYFDEDCDEAFSCYRAEHIDGKLKDPSEFDNLEEQVRKFCGGAEFPHRKWEAIRNEMDENNIS